MHTCACAHAHPHPHPLTPTHPSAHTHMYTHTNTYTHMQALEEAQRKHAGQMDELVCTHRAEVCACHAGGERVSALIYLSRVPVQACWCLHGCACVFEAEMCPFDELETLKLSS